VPTAASARGLALAIHVDRENRQPRCPCAAACPSRERRRQGAHHDAQKSIDNPAAQRLERDGRTLRILCRNGGAFAPSSMAFAGDHRRVRDDDPGKQLADQPAHGTAGRTAAQVNSVGRGVFPGLPESAVQFLEQGGELPGVGGASARSAA
jgi:hypothetical protein